MKKLILVAAPPACGKTYVSELLAKSLNNAVYLDKDDLRDLLLQGFNLAGEKIDMDGSFYLNNLRDAEYSTAINIALSALRFNDTVILNAPFIKEVKNPSYMQGLKEKVQDLNAKLVLIWVTAPKEVVYERIKARNSERDKPKLVNLEEYVKKTDYSLPNNLENSVDFLMAFDNSDNKTAQNSLFKILTIINKE